MRFSRPLALVALIGLSASLAACGADGDTDPDGSATVVEPSTTSSTETGSAAGTETSPATGSGTATSDPSAGSVSSTGSGAWTFNTEADGTTIAAVPEKTGRNGAALTFTHDPNLTGRAAKVALDPGSRESCALGYETRLSVDGGAPQTVLGSNVDGNADVVLFDERAVWKQVAQAKTVTIEVPTGPNCRSADATWTTYEFDVTGAADLPMDKGWTR